MEEQLTELEENKRNQTSALKKKLKEAEDYSQSLQTEKSNLQQKL